MLPHQDIAVAEPSQVGEARRAAVRLAQELGFGELDQGRVALVVTELGTNLARHAQGGRILLAARPAGGRPALEVLSLDEGPGMASVASCLADGFSTSGTPGTGLGAVQRLADEFSVFSQLGRGTVIAAHTAKREGGAAVAPGKQVFSVGAVGLPAPGESISGDGWAASLQGARARVLMADGLGHGPLAAEAADAALAVFAGAAGQRPAQVLESAHAAMRSTRGAAVAMAVLDAAAATVVFCGAGNVAGRIISGVEDRSLLSQHGTVGLQIRRLQDIEYAWPQHAIVVLHSDGIVSRWSLADTPGLLQCHPSVIAGWILHDHCRGRDDATVLVIRRN